MKTSYLIIFLTLFLLSACAHVNVNELRTVSSDIFPGGITRTEYYRQLAWGYYLDGKTVESIELYRLSLLHDPKNVTSKIQLADAFRKEKIEHLASAQLTEVLKIEPNNLLALRKLGDLYLDTQIFSKALQIYTYLVNLNPADEKAQWAVFYIHKLDQSYDKALAQLQKIEKLNTVTDEALQLTVREKAAIYRLQKNWSEEQKYLIIANRLMPNFYGNISLLSDSYFRDKNWQAANEILQRFSDTNDFNFEISEKLAFVSVQLQNYDVALREYSKQRPWIYDPLVIDLKTAHVYFLMKNYKTAEAQYLAFLEVRDDDEAKYYLSKIYQLTDRQNESVGLLDHLQPMSEYFGDSQVELADFDKKNGNLDKAVNRLRKAHMKRPDLLALYIGYADLMIENKRYVESVALIEQGIGFHPNDEELRFKMAFIHYRLNNQKSFKRQLAKAIEINPKNSGIYAGLAELWYVKGKEAADVEYFVRKAIQLKSKNQNLKPLLSWALMEQNKSAEAIAVFEDYYDENPTEHFYVKTLADIYRLGHVTAKAESFAKVATVLYVSASLKEKLLNKILTGPAVLEPYDKSNSRMPASLENY